MANKNSSNNYGIIVPVTTIRSSGGSSGGSKQVTSKSTSWGGTANNAGARSSGVDALVTTATKNRSRYTDEAKKAGLSGGALRAERESTEPTYSTKYLQEAEKNRASKVKEYQTKSRELEELESFVTTQEQYDALNGKREELAKLGKEIDAADELLGNGKHLYGETERARAGVSGWAKGRAAGDLGIVGNLLQMTGSGKIMDEAASLGYYDGDTNDIIYDPLRQAAENAGNTVFGKAQELRGQSNEEWKQATQDLSQAGQTAANVARGVADVALDTVENQIVPGAGTLRMYAGAWGNEALDQAEKENNSIEAQTMAGLKAAASAWLSTKMFGGIETYGDSVAKKAFGNAIDKVMTGNAGKVAKVLLNTEGLEEGLEDVLNVAGDRLLGLDPEARLDWNEVKSDAVVGYIIGVLFGGASAGLEFTHSDLQALANEAVDSALRGETFDDAILAAGTQAGIAEEIPVVRGRHEAGNVETAARTSPREETQVEVEKARPWVNQLSNKQAERILTDPQLRTEFEQLTGISLDGMTKAEARRAIKAGMEAQDRATRDVTLGNIMDEVRGWEAEQEAEQGTPALGEPKYEGLTQEEIEALESFPGQHEPVNTEAEAEAEPYEGRHAAPETGYEGLTQEEIDALESYQAQLRNNKVNIDNAAIPAYNNAEVNGNDRAGSTGENQNGVPRVPQNSGEEARSRGEHTGSSENPGIVLLSDKARSILKKRGVAVVDLKDQTANTAAFSAALDAARDVDADYGWAVTPKSVEDLDVPGMKVLMNEDGTAGLAVAPDGDIEAVFRNKASGPKGATKSTIPTAIANGGTKLDCYGRDLVDLYAQYGFIPVARVTFNPEYANPGWDESKGHPDIFFMMHSGDDADAVIAKHGTYDSYLDKDLDALPVMEYDEAYAYRDSLLEQRNNQSAGTPPEPPQINARAQTSNDTKQQGNANLSGLTRENEVSRETEQKRAPETELSRTIRQANEGRPSTKPAENIEQKVSQHYENIIKARRKGAAPISYEVHHDADVLAKAISSLETNMQGTVNSLLDSPMWDDVQVQQSRQIANQLLADGDLKTAELWDEIETERASKLGQALRQLGVDNLTAESDGLKVYKTAKKMLENLTENKLLTKTQTEQTLKAVEEYSQRLAKAQAMLKGTPSKQTQAQAKARLLSLIEDINNQRNVGMFADMGKAEQKHFHKLLQNEDIDYIRRFAAQSVAGVASDAALKANRKTVKGRAAALNAYQKLAHLTGFGTWGRNIVGNTSMGIVDVLANDTGGQVADLIASAFTGKRSLGMEAGVLSKKVRDAGMRDLRRSVLEIASNIDIAGDVSSGKYDISAIRNFRHDTEASIAERFFARWQQLNGYALESTDQFFMGAARESAMQAAKRANKKISKKELEAIGKQAAEYRTFKNRGEYGKTAEAANRTRDLFNILGIGGEGITHKGGFGLGTANLPYATVPANIGVKLAEFSPLNTVKGAIELASVVANQKKTGKLDIAKQYQASTDMGRGLTGTALIALLATALKGPWFKDWDNEDDKNVRQQNKLEGKYGQMFNLSMMKRFLDGDKDATWRNTDKAVDMSFNEPANQMVALAALLNDTATEKAKEGEKLDAVDYGDAWWRTTFNSVMGIPAMQTIQNLSNAYQYSTMDRAIGKGVDAAVSTSGSVAAGFIPAPVRHLVNAADPYQRETGGNTAGERAANQIIAASPWRQKLDVKTDAYGNEVSAGSVGTRIANQYLPGKHTEINQSDVSREIQRVREETGDDYTPDYNGPKSVSFGSGKDKETVKLTTEQSREYKKTVGAEMNKAVETLMKTANYKTSSFGVQSEILAEMQTYSRDLAKDNLAKEEGIKRSEDYDTVRTLDDPVGFLANKVRFNKADKAGDFKDIDVVTKNMQTMSETDREQALKNNSLKSYWNAAQADVNAQTNNQFNEGVKARYKERGSTAASGADIFAEIAAGNYSKHDADYFMNRQEKDGSWVVGKGRHNVYQAVTDAGYDAETALDFWTRTQQADIDAGKSASTQGTLTKKEFNRQINAFPEPYRSEIKKSVYAAMGW